MTKRQLGFVFISLGVLGIVGIPLYDLLRHKPLNSPVQWAAMAGCAVLILAGAILLPLRDVPA